MSQHKAYWQGVYSFRHLPAVRSLAPNFVATNRDPNSQDILEVFKSFKLLCQDLRGCFLSAFSSQFVFKFSTLINSSTCQFSVKRLGRRGKNTESHADLYSRICSALATSETSPLGTCCLICKTQGDHDSSGY